MTERRWHPSIPDAETCWERVQTLSPSERAVIELLAGGFAIKEIARARGTAPKTVQKLLSSVYDKFGTFGGQVSTLAFFARATEAPGFETA